MNFLVVCIGATVGLPVPSLHCRGSSFSYIDVIPESEVSRLFRTFRCPPKDGIMAVGFV